MLAEVDKNQEALATYTYGHERISMHRMNMHGGNVTSLYLYDGLGNVRALASITGTITDTYEYTAYGETLKETGNTENPYRYRGEQSDSTTGLYYLRARYMNPSTGQFLSKDRYEGDTSNPITLHKYLYAHANPVTYEDPSGYFAITKTNIATAIQAIILTIGTVGSVQVLRLTSNMAQDWGQSLQLQYGLINIFEGMSTGAELWSMFNQAIRAARGDSEAVEEASGAGVSAGAGVGAPNPNDDKNKKEYKEKIKVKGKQKDDIPDRFRGERPYKGESGKDAAKRILKEYGEYDSKNTGPDSNFNKLKKYFDTHFK